MALVCCFVVLVGWFGWLVGWPVGGTSRRGVRQSVIDTLGWFSVYKFWLLVLHSVHCSILPR